MKTTIQVEEEGATALLLKQARRTRARGSESKSSFTTAERPQITCLWDQYQEEEAARKTIIMAPSGERRSLAYISHEEKFRALRTYEVPFVDIDLVPDESDKIPARAKILARVSDYSQEHPEWGCRIYVTRNGLRLLVTSEGQQRKACNPGSVRMMVELGADPKYLELSMQRNAYAARLDVKRARCTLPVADYAVTSFMMHIGNPRIAPDAQFIIDLHDKETKATEGKPLA